MDNLIKTGRIFYAIAITAIGIQHFIYSHFVTELVPFPASIPGQSFWVYFTGTFLVISGLGLFLVKTKPLPAIQLAVFLFLWIVLLHLPQLAQNIHAPNAWTTIAEVLALCGGALIIAGTFPATGNKNINSIIKLGRYLYAASLIVFCVQHFMYAEFISMLITAWIPFKLFWAYFFGIAFIAAAISIASGFKGRLISTLLGIMFLLWVMVLHIPRVIAASGNGKEWTSLFVALAMSGIAFTLAGTFRKEN